MKCFWILVCVLTTVRALRSVGDLCALSAGRTGICRTSSDCLTRTQNICGYQGGSLIVCCGDRPPSRRTESLSTSLYPSKPYRESEYYPAAGLAAGNGRLSGIQREQEKIQANYQDRTPPIRLQNGNHRHDTKRPTHLTPEIDQPRPFGQQMTAQSYQNSSPLGRLQNENHRHDTIGPTYLTSDIEQPILFEETATQGHRDRTPPRRLQNGNHRHDTNRPTHLTPEIDQPRPFGQQMTTQSHQNSSPLGRLQNGKHKHGTNGPTYLTSEIDQPRPFGQQMATQSHQNSSPLGRLQNSNHRHDTNGPTYLTSERDEPLRKCQIKCKEYSKTVVHTVQALPLLPDPTPVEAEIAHCDIKTLPLIVGGEKTVPGEFPHMAALGFQDGRNIVWKCAGSLISEKYILTASHCTHSSTGPPVIARLGELNLKRGDNRAKPSDYTISDIIPHPSYKPSSKYHDIALLRLSRRVQFTKLIRPGCLFTENKIPANKTIATGWGKTSYTGNWSEVLRKVSIDIIDNSRCNHYYDTLTHTDALRQGITSTMLCAGELSGGKDACQGDSGGPLQITMKQNKCVYYIIGVVSFGKYCGAASAPGIYTRVSEYISWIESEVWS